MMTEELSFLVKVQKLEASRKPEAGLLLARAICCAQRGFPALLPSPNGCADLQPV